MPLGDTNYGAAVATPISLASSRFACDLDRVGLAHLAIVRGVGSSGDCPDRVRLLGWKTHEEIVTCLRGAHVILQPSAEVHEGRTIVLM